MLLAIEGRRRRIPALSAFMALAHVVNLAFAQNLFYLALILTPAPIATGDDDLRLPVAPIPTSTLARIRHRLISPKPTNWCPHPVLFLGSLTVNLVAIFLLPHAAGTPSFLPIVVLARAATFFPLFISKVVPVSWGTVHPHPHNAYSSFTTLFRVLSLATFALHAKATVLGLAYNTPDSQYHRHSRFIPWDLEERSAWERSTTALGKVLGSTSDHPVVAAAGWDVLLCTLSLGLWAAVRATDVQDILTSTIPLYRAQPSPSLTKQEDTSVPDIKTEDDESEPDLPATPRQRSRFNRTSTSSGASSTASTPSPQRNRRPKSAEEAPGDVGERAYEPSAKEAREVVEGDVLPSGELDWESAALAWGLAALGGLGSACAGVFGAECISR
jgi:hypothetical protein